MIESTLGRLSLQGCRAVIGPCISVEAYEVGPELVVAVAECGVPRDTFLREDLGPKPHVDLRAAATWKLTQLGLQPAHISHCTWGDPRFPSYRRNGPLSGRMLSLIGLRC